MKEERIMSFQMSKKLDEASIEAVNGAANFHFPQPTFNYNSSGGFSVSLDG